MSSGEGDQPFCAQFYALALRPTVLVAQIRCWSFLISPAIRWQRTCGFIAMTSPQSHLSARRARLRPDHIPIDPLGDLDAFELRRVTSAGMGLLHRRPPRTTLSDVVREFAPNWFTVTMGTGAFALALNQFPLPLPGASDIAGGLWLLDLMLFVLFTILYAARWIFFFDGARQIFWHPVLSMFLGAIPMGLATIINGLLVFGVPFWGKSAVSVAHALWWADAAMSVACS